MAVTGPIHWHEGLFLQPHHLQGMQKQLTDQFGSERRLLRSYPYGLVESRMSLDALKNFNVRFDRLRIIMPSGLEVSVPDNADLPALPIKEAFEATSNPITVFIGVPLWYESRGNTIAKLSEDDWRAKCLYRVADVERVDENTGENSQAVRIRRLNARLLMEHEDRADLEVLPLLQVVHGTDQDVGLPATDARFVPACYVLGGSPMLQGLVRDLGNAIEAAQKQLTAQLSRSGVTAELIRGPQFEQMLRLQVLSRHAARLPSLAQAAGVTPFEVYLELRALLAELTALHPDEKELEVPAYNHDAPGIVFLELTGRIKAKLKPGFGPWLEVKFAPDGRVLTAPLTDEHLTRPNEYYLAIRTNQDGHAVTRLVENGDEFKLMPRSMVHLAIYGLKLMADQSAWTLPMQQGLHYFRLYRSESKDLWKRIVAEKQMSIRWPGMETSDFSISLYMTLPEEENRKP